MRRRGVGIGAVRKKQEQTKQFSEVGEQIVESNLSHVSSQLELFRTNLQAFAVKYKDNIKKDPDFRCKFQVMCAKIGVDPLASKKGFWSELLDVGDFYYELAVQIIEVGILTRPKNGGLLGMSDLLRLLKKKRGQAMQTVTDDDVKRAVKKLSIVTVPVVLSQDHSTVLALAQATEPVEKVEMQRRVFMVWPSYFRECVCLLIPSFVLRRWGSHDSCASTATSRSRTRTKRGSVTTADATTRPMSSSGTTVSQVCRCTEWLCAIW
uniref:Vacuolar protein sorting-associated protein n=1 Tax=Hyaloperonospora arabidopsidis (strain Emoy2) TaxID=559515 RepID=M4B590_HYAAE